MSIAAWPLDVSPYTPLLRAWEGLMSRQKVGITNIFSFGAYFWAARSGGAIR